MISRRALFAGLVAFLSVLAVSRGAVPFASSQWYTPASLTFPKISPDGHKLVAMVRKTAHQQILVEYDTATLHPKPLASIENATVHNVFWKGNDRLLLLVESDSNHNGFWAYDFKAQKLARLGLMNSHVLGLVALLPAEPDSILVSSFFSRGYHLSKLNLATGSWESAEGGKDDIAHWFVNRTGTAIAGLGFKDSNYFLITRPTPKDAWSRQELGPLNHPDLLPVGVMPDQKRLVAWDYAGSDIARVVALDPATMAREILFSPVGDEAERLETAGDDFTHPVAVVVAAEKPQRFFFDDEARELQAALDAALPQTVNSVQSVSEDGKMVMVMSFNDREFGAYYLLDRTRHKLVRLGRQISEFNSELFGASQPVTFAARDGLVLHGRLTLPPASAATKNPAPLVVSVGSGIAGPKQQYGFDGDDQIFATRGYAVLHLSYRGTAGYGRAFRDAGNGQIEKGMVDDLDDAIHWFGQKGLIDESRVALRGEYLGGIVAINALARSHAYSAWINWHGATDIHKADEKSVLEVGFEWGGGMAEAGGHQDGQDYRTTFAPRKLMRQIRVPSFHFYAQGRDAGNMEDMLKSVPAEHVFIREPANYELSDYPKIVGPVIDQMLDFLDRHLGVAGSAK